MFSKRFFTLLHKSYKVRNAAFRLYTDTKMESSNTKGLQGEKKTPYEKTINQVTLLGRVGTEPAKKGTPEHPVLVFTMATHTNYKYDNGEFKEKTDWHRICVFKPSLRELAFTYLQKGMRVHVTGKISYSTVSEGETMKSITSIVADDIIFLHHDGPG